MNNPIFVLFLSACSAAVLSTSFPVWRKELEELKFKREIDAEVQPMGDSIVEINIKSGAAGALFQGDIVLTKEQQDEIAVDISGDRSKRQAFNAKGWSAELWSEGVPYMFNYGLNSEAKNAFKKAADLWMKNTCINFTEYEIPKGKVNKPMRKTTSIILDFYKYLPFNGG